VIKKKQTNIIIIGFGVAGRRYFDILKKKNTDIFIVRKSKNKIFFKNKNIAISKNELTNVLLKKIDLAIIASPVKTHWYFLKLFLKLKIDIIVEKPVVYNSYQFLKINNLIKNFNNNFYINHSDLYNQNFLNLLNKKKFKVIKKIIFYYGNDKNFYRPLTHDSPMLDWLPHILSIIIFFLKDITTFKINSYSRVIKNGLIYEKCFITLSYRKIISKVYFSNFPRKNLRTFRLYNENGYINFDSYYDKNFIVYKKKKNKLNFCSTKTFDNLINIALKNINKKKQNDFYLFEKYFYVYSKIKSKILSKNKTL
jgi:predicted dehydrogenase